MQIVHNNQVAADNALKGPVCGRIFTANDFTDLVMQTPAGGTLNVTDTGSTCGYDVGWGSGLETRATVRVFCDSLAQQNWSNFKTHTSATAFSGVPGAVAISDPSQGSTDVAAMTAGGEYVEADLDVLSNLGVGTNPLVGNSSNVVAAVLHRAVGNATTNPGC